MSRSTGTDSGSECAVSNKRKRNPEVYKRNFIRIAKVKGKEHVNWKGKHVKGRNTGPNCNCSEMCLTKLSDEEKAGVLNRFNEFSNKNELTTID